MCGSSEPSAEPNDAHISRASRWSTLRIIEQRLRLTRLSCMLDGTMQPK